MFRSFLEQYDFSEPEPAEDFPNLGTQLGIVRSNLAWVMEVSFHCFHQCEKSPATNLFVIIMDLSSSLRLASKLSSIYKFIKLKREVAGTFTRKNPEVRCMALWSKLLVASEVPAWTQDLQEFCAAFWTL